MLVLEVILWRTFISRLFATLLRNHTNYRYNCACEFIGKSAVIKCHQLLSKVTNINRKSLFDQLATASSSTTPLTPWELPAKYVQLVIDCNCFAVSNHYGRKKNVPAQVSNLRPLVYKTKKLLWNFKIEHFQSLTTTGLTNKHFMTLTNQKLC